MTSERADLPANPEIHHDVPGQALAAQREKMGWSVEQVADQLKLAVRQVVALEAGDYASLPSPAVVRGFVRAYAKILKLDPAPLVAMVPVDTPDPAERPATSVRRDKPVSFNEVRFSGDGKRSSLPLGVIAAAILIGGGIGVAWQMGMLPGSPAPSQAVAEPAAGGLVLETPVAASATATGGAAPTGLLDSSVPLINVPAPATAGATAPVDGAATPAAPLVVAPTPAPPVAGAAATAPAAAATAPAPAAAPAGQDALVIDVRADSWIEVRTASGKVLLSRMAKGGTSETVQVNEPVTLVVGNTPGVSATLRGAPVALTGKSVSRVSLK